MIGLGGSWLFLLCAAASGASLPDFPSAVAQEPVFKLVRTVDDPEKYAGRGGNGPEWVYLVNRSGAKLGNYPNETNLQFERTVTAGGHPPAILRPGVKFEITVSTSTSGKDAGWSSAGIWSDLVEFATEPPNARDGRAFCEPNGSATVTYRCTATASSLGWKDKGSLIVFIGGGPQMVRYEYEKASPLELPGQALDAGRLEARMTIASKPPYRYETPPRVAVEVSGPPAPRDAPLGPSPGVADPTTVTLFLDNAPVASGTTDRKGRVEFRGYSLAGSFPQGRSRHHLQARAVRGNLAPAEASEEVEFLRGAREVFVSARAGGGPRYRPGETVRVTGRVLIEDGGVWSDGESVPCQVILKPPGWAQIGSTRTKPDGTFELEFSLTGDLLQYRSVAVEAIPSDPDRFLPGPGASLTFEFDVPTQLNIVVTTERSVYGEDDIISVTGEITCAQRPIKASVHLLLDEREVARGPSGADGRVRLEMPVREMFEKAALIPASGHHQVMLQAEAEGYTSGIPATAYFMFVEKDSPFRPGQYLVAEVQGDVEIFPPIALGDEIVVVNRPTLRPGATFTQGYSFTVGEGARLVLLFRPSPDITTTMLIEEKMSVRVVAYVAGGSGVPKLSYRTAGSGRMTVNTHNPKNLPFEVTRLR
jgi:hypothetical protein